MWHPASENPYSLHARRAPWQGGSSTAAPTAAGADAAFVNNTAFAAPVVLQDSSTSGLDLVTAGAASTASTESVRE